MMDFFFWRELDKSWMEHSLLGCYFVDMFVFLQEQSATELFDTCYLADVVSTGYPWLSVGGEYHLCSCFIIIIVYVCFSIKIINLYVSAFYCNDISRCYVKSFYYCIWLLFSFVFLIECILNCSWFRLNVVIFYTVLIGGNWFVLYCVW